MSEYDDEVIAEYVGGYYGNYETFVDHNQPIVRCRDCYHYHEAGIASHTPFCEWMNDSDVTPDGFCAWGERKWLTCKCGEELESEGKCPSCGRWVHE